MEKCVGESKTSGECAGIVGGEDRTYTESRTGHVGRRPPVDKE